ncbi:MAG: protein kinase [Vicinamibacterales bacterium]
MKEAHDDAVPMTPDTWTRITALFEQALERPPGDRPAFLAGLGRQDAEAAAEVASLLEAHDRPGAFLPELPLPPSPWPDAGDLTERTVGAYRLLGLLGTGGSGAVYLAERSDGAFDKRVAVKLLSAAWVQSRERFVRERQFLARLDHPNIARLIDGGATADHLLYLVMEYVDGLPIDRYCAERRLPVTERLALLQQVCAGVGHAHRHLIVHCDIKPENLLVTPDGTVKVVDFGIARLLGPPGAVTRLRPATPGYASPEQLGGGDISTASDVFSLGVVGYVLLTGSGPFAGVSDSVDAVVHATLTAEPHRASTLCGTPALARSLRGDLDNVLAKAVARDPARRYRSVEQFADDLEAYRRGFPVRARPDTWAYRCRRAIGRHRVAYAFGVTLGLGLVASTTLSVWQARRAERRFDDLRSFARAVVFDVNDLLTPISGTTAARQLVVQTALQYLDRLSQDEVTDTDLREELAAAYLRIGKVQGGAFVPNIGDSPGAAASFSKAIAAAGDGGTAALERLRIDGLISLAQLAPDPLTGAHGFDEAIAAAGRRLAADPGDAESVRLLADAVHGRATVAHLTADVEHHLALAEREVRERLRLRALAGDRWQDDLGLARARAQVALARDQRDDAAGALAELDSAQTALDAAVAGAGPNQLLQRGLAEIHSRKASVLVALGRPADAAREARTGIGLLQPLVASDAANVQYKADLAFGYVQLGDAARADGRLAEALDLHQRALAIRRERAARFGGFIFVPWELTRSLNSVADLLLTIAPPDVDGAGALFAEARAVGRRTLEAAPSYTQVRRQVAVAEAGLARVAEARGGRRP